MDHYDALASHRTSLHSLSNSKHKSRSAEPIGSLSVVATGDEWNRNTPAVHPKGRSALAPGRPLCVIDRRLESWWWHWPVSILQGDTMRRQYSQVSPRWN